MNVLSPLLFHADVFSCLFWHLGKNKSAKERHGTRAPVASDFLLSFCHLGPSWIVHWRHGKPSGTAETFTCFCSVLVGTNFTHTLLEQSTMMTCEHRQAISCKWGPVERAALPLGNCVCMREGEKKIEWLSGNVVKMAIHESSLREKGPWEIGEESSKEKKELLIGTL